MVQGGYAQNSGFAGYQRALAKPAQDAYTL